MEYQEIIYALFAGISCKVYDDFNDNNLIKSDLAKEILKGSHWILITLVSMNDFNFSVMWYLMCFANYIANQTNSKVTGITISDEQEKL